MFSSMEVGMPMERKKATVFFMPSRAAFSSSASVTPQTFRAKRAKRDGFVRYTAFAQAPQTVAREAPWAVSNMADSSCPS